MESWEQQDELVNKTPWEQQDEVVEGTLPEQLVGGFAKGGMQLGQAVIEAPSIAVKQLNVMRQYAFAGKILHEKDPLVQEQLRQQMKESDSSFNIVSDWLAEPAKLHAAGQQIIEKNHPEWATNPPKGFVDLVTHPGKLGVAIAESLPVLLGAGILTAAGQPNLALGLMYVTEGQQAYDQAKADGASDQDAAIAYAVYGSVSAALEQMQLQQFLKIGRGNFNTVLNRVAQKSSLKGLKSLTYDTLKVMAQEAVEEMAQGTWQELTAKAIYNKDIPGTIWDFIDRRAQEGFVAGVMGGAIGIGGAVAGHVKAGYADASLNEDTVAEQVTKRAETEIPADTPPEVKDQKIAQMVEEQIVGNIQTRERIVSKFPQKVVDQKSLEEVGNAIADELGISHPEKWVFSSRRKDYVVTGTNRNKGAMMTIRPGRKSFKVGSQSQVNWAWNHIGLRVNIGDVLYPSQAMIKRVIIHELLHTVQPKGARGPGGRRSHHPTDFKRSVQEKVKNLFATKIVPVTEKPPTIAQDVSVGVNVPTKGDTHENLAARSLKKEGKRGIDKIFTNFPGLEIKSIREGSAHFVTPEGRILSVSPSTHDKLASSVGMTSEDVLSEGTMRTRVQASGILVEFGPNPTEKQISLAKTFVDEHGDRADRIVVAWVDNSGTVQVRESSIETPRIFLNKTLRIMNTTLEKTGAIPTGPEKEKTITQRKSRRQTLKAGHDIPGVLGWDDTTRRAFMQKIVGKTSMKDMTLPEAKKVVEAMYAEAKRLGYELQTAGKLEQVSEGLVETLQKTKPKITETGEYNPSLWRRFVHGLGKMKAIGGEIFGMRERFFEALDGRSPDGLFQKLILHPLMEASSLSRINAFSEQMELVDVVEKLETKKIEYMWRPQKIKGTKHKLTSMEKIGVVGLSENETGFNRLLESGFSEKDITAIRNSITPDEHKVYSFIMAKFEQQWKILVNSAVQAGWDLGKLKKEFRYVPIEDANPAERRDYTDQLAEYAAGKPVSPESRMLLLRVPGGKGKINLDLSQLYMNNAIRVQRFIQMAPLAKKLRSIVSNQRFLGELNNRTYNMGVKILNNFISDKIRGGIPSDTQGIESISALLRRKATAFAAGRNVLMVMRQPLALFSSMADEPALIPYIIKNSTQAAWWGGKQELTDFVNARSLLMKDRDIGRDVHKIYKRKELVQTIKKRLSHRSVNWYAGADKAVANIAWKSYYEYSMDKLSPGNEKAALEYADSRITKTQSLVHKEDLPGLYRGGELSQNIAVFTRELATLGNYWVHDVYGAKIRGDIGWGKFGYRVMMSQIIPALVFGMIARGRLPRDWKEAGIDLGTYTVAPTILLGGLVNRLITGLDSGLIAYSGWESFFGVIQQAKKLPNWEDMTDEEKASTIRMLIKKTAMTIGAFTGKITAQDIRTMEGAYDLMMGNSTDPRRLIWSEYALTKGNKEDEESTYGGGYILP